MPCGNRALPAVLLAAQQICLFAKQSATYKGRAFHRTPPRSRVGSRREPGLRMMPSFPRLSLSFRTAGFLQYGWKVGFPSGAFLDRRQLKPAPDMRCPSSSLHPPFVLLGVNAVIPHCVGPQTRLRTAMEGYYSSTPGVLARVRVIVSRSVITYSTPSVPLASTPRFRRMAAYTRCLRCAGAHRRPASGSGLSLLIPS